MNQGEHFMGFANRSDNGLEDLARFERFSTLVDVIEYNSAHDPDSVKYNAITFADGDRRCETKITNQALDRQIKNVAAALQEYDAKGERALLVYPPGLSYITSFWACLFSGIIAVPAYPPFNEKLTERLSSIAKDSGAKLVLTSQDIQAFVKPAIGKYEDLSSLKWVCTDMFEADGSGAYRPPAINGDTIAFLQYTSGSTSLPKGVKLTHKNILHNLEAIRSICGYSCKERGLMWLPQFHDMGLVGGVMQSVYSNFFLSFMSPLDFLQRPYRWLHAMSDYKATISGGPNFAYDFCVKRIGEQEKAGLDLSNWKLAGSGGEPVRADTLKRFGEAFAPCGFRPQAYYPGYGLAESTFFICCVAPDKIPRVIHLDARALEHHRVKKVSANATNCRPVVSNGAGVSGCRILIVDPQSLCTCGENQIGEIWTSSGSVGPGYWNRAEESQAVFKAYTNDTGQGPFLRTGDLGFVDSGELFVTGRLKDLIIIRGANHYPQDIEKTVEQSHSALRKGCGAAFSVEADDDEHLIIVQEIKKQSIDAGTDPADILSDIRRAVIRNHEITPFNIILIEADTIGKTSSGKIQRQRTKRQYMEKALKPVIFEKNSKD
jgi:acyl-CoA synthetase (AMP-forming)/AMP-acid ligase II